MITWMVTWWKIRDSLSSGDVFLITTLVSSDLPLNKQGDVISLWSIMLLHQTKTVELECKTKEKTAEAQWIHRAHTWYVRHYCFRFILIVVQWICWNVEYFTLNIESKFNKYVFTTNALRKLIVCGSGTEEITIDTCQKTDDAIS